MTQEQVRPRFIILNTHLIGQQYVLLGPSVTIGRTPDCECLLDQNSVSRHHARIEQSGGRFYITDLNSRNGIQVWNQPVTRAELRHGDVFTIGEVQIRFECPAPGQGPAPGPTRIAQAPTAIGTPAGVARPLTGGDIAGAAGAPFPSPAAGAAETGGQEAVQAGRGSALGLALLGILILAVAVGIWVFMTGVGSGARVGKIKKSVELIKVGEKCWTRLDFNWDFTNHDVSIEDDSVATAERDGPGELLITGLSVGETTIYVSSSHGERAAVRALVRGLLRDPIDDLLDLQLSDDERIRRGRAFFENGKAIENEQPYVAYQEYRKAEAVLGPLPHKGGLYVEVRSARDRAKKKVDDRLEQLRKEVRIAIVNKNRLLAMSLLEKIMQLIPGESDPRHQRADGRRLEIIRQELREQEARRKGRRRL